MASPTPQPSPTLHTAYANHILRHYVLKKYNQREGLDNNTELPRRYIHSPSGSVGFVPHDTSANIGIIGAGAAGLAIALHLLDSGYRNIEIFEASSRYGGRCYTYNFSSDSSCAHNYYDVGAMRIPDIPTMASTFAMIKLVNSRLPETDQVTLKDYTYDAGTEPSMYAYGQIDPKSDPDSAAFQAFMLETLTANNFIGPTANFNTAFWDFINSAGQPDHFSTRGYLMKSPYNAGAAPLWTYNQTERAETLNTSTGLFDQAFMETLCDFYDFQNAEKTRWYRVENGMSALTQAMYTLCTQSNVTVTTNATVTAMTDNGSTIGVTYLDSSGNSQTKTYATVFNTTTFGSLERMDIQGLKLSADNLTGIRGLSYDRATKVAIKFKSAWWQPLVKQGGVSGTDLPISNVIYPSWPDEQDKPWVAIMSYSWAQDASRMASLIPANDQESTDVKDPIVQLCLQNLAKLWTNQKTISPPPDVADLESLYISHHAFAWSHDPNTAGAFALFGPGQFEYLYPQFTQPLCGNKFWIIGEAVSPHHAWISGAIDSAYVTTMQWLHGIGDVEGKQRLEASMLGGGEDHNVAAFDLTLHFLNVELAEHGVKS